MKNDHFERILPAFFILLFIAGCSTTQMHTYSIDEKETICENKSVDLGHTVILPEAAWRKDQKEPVIREQMALKEINKAFKDFPCGSVSFTNGVKAFSNWTALPQQEMLSRFSNQRIDTVIIIRIEELTPRLGITFSIPFLWSGTNEADFRIKVISVNTGNILNDMRVKRVTGGPFNIRPA